jgi:hypothetical protein
LGVIGFDLIDFCLKGKVGQKESENSNKADDHKKRHASL